MCYASSVGESFLDDNAFSRSILFFLHLGNPLFPSLSISWNQCHEGRPYMWCLLCWKCRGDPGGRPQELHASSFFLTAVTISSRSNGLPIISIASVCPTNRSSTALLVVVRTNWRPCACWASFTSCKNCQFSS